MKTAILKGVGLLAMVGCEAETPAAMKAGRGELQSLAVRAEQTLEAQGGATETPACRRGETRIYACDFGDRRVAVCAAGSRLSYRFGDDHRTDLEIDSRPRRVRAHTGAVVGGGGGRQDYIRFSNNGYQYIVHSMVAGSLTEVPGKRFSGVTVVRGDNRDAPVVRTLQCPQAGPAQIIDPTRALPEGTFIPDEGDAWSAWW